MRRWQSYQPDEVKCRWTDDFTALYKEILVEYNVKYHMQYLPPYCHKAVVAHQSTYVIVIVAYICNGDEQLCCIVFSEVMYFLKSQPSILSKISKPFSVLSEADH